MSIQSFIQFSPGKRKDSSQSGPPLFTLWEKEGSLRLNLSNYSQVRAQGLVTAHQDPEVTVADSTVSTAGGWWYTQGGTG